MTLCHSTTPLERNPSALNEPSGSQRSFIVPPVASCSIRRRGRKPSQAPRTLSVSPIRQTPNAQESLEQSLERLLPQDSASRGSCVHVLWRFAYLLNPNSLNLAEAEFIRASVVDVRGFDIRVPGHALCNPYVATVLHLVGDTIGAERMNAYRQVHLGVDRTPAHYVPRFDDKSLHRFQ
jgi:hypothetical protein